MSNHFGRILAPIRACYDYTHQLTPQTVYRGLSACGIVRKGCLLVMETINPPLMINPLVLVPHLSLTK